MLGFKMGGVCLLQTVDAKYAKVTAGVGPDQEVIFEEEQITLDIPKEGLVLESGWTITPHTHPGVSLCECTTINQTKNFNCVHCGIPNRSLKNR